MNLSDWLMALERNPSPSAHFTVCDISEHASPVAAVINDLANAVVRARSSIEFLREVAPLLGWGLVSRRVAATARPVVRRGDFGEVLATEWLKEHHGFSVPVNKLRYQILANQTQPGADSVALETSAGEVVRLHLVETKLRTTRNTESAFAAYSQHANRSPAEVDALLLFILERLYERRDPMCESLSRHLATRVDEPNDAYHIVLVYDKDVWSERTLDHLDAAAGTLHPVRVHVVRVARLRELVDDVFGAIGVDVLDDLQDVDEPGHGANDG